MVDFQIFVNLLHALQAAALRILIILISFSVQAIHAPDILKVIDFFKVNAIVCFNGRSLAEIEIPILGLSSIHLSLTFATEVSTRVQSRYCACCTSSDRKAMLSAKSRSVSASVWSNSPALLTDKLEAKLFFSTVNHLP